MHFCSFHLPFIYQWLYLSGMEWMESDVRTWDRTADRGCFYVKVPGRNAGWVSSRQSSKKEAIRWALSVARGGALKERTLSDFARDFFLVGKCDFIASRESETRSRTSKYWADLRSVLELYLFEKWGDWFLSSVSPAQFFDWLVVLKSVKHGERLSGRVRKRVRDVAIIIWDWAVFRGVVSTNQLRSVPSVPQLPEKRRAFRSDELERMFPADLSEVWPSGRNMKGISWGVFFLLAAETGLRPQELCALQWEDWRPAAKTFIVSRALGEDGEGKGLKTEHKGVKKKAAPVSDRLADLLTNTTGPHTGYLCARLDGRPQRVDGCGKVFNHVLDYSHPQTGRRYYRGLRNMEVVRGGRTLYSLRHTANTRFLTTAAAKIAEEAQVRMGHTTNTMTSNYDDPDELDLLARVGRA